VNVAGTFLQGIDASGADGHPCPFLGKRQGGDFADSHAATHDNSGLAGKSELDKASVLTHSVLFHDDLQ
jgi:hypothetical protein